MWEFDNYGDLYFEKAVQGFLADLFTQWKVWAHLYTITLILPTFRKSEKTMECDCDNLRP